MSWLINLFRTVTPVMRKLVTLISEVSDQKWSRGHRARGQDQGQGHKKNPKPSTALPRKDTLEAKDRNARG